MLGGCGDRMGGRGGGSVVRRGRGIRGRVGHRLRHLLGCGRERHEVFVRGGRRGREHVDDHLRAVPEVLDPGRLGQGQRHRGPVVSGLCLGIEHVAEPPPGEAPEVDPRRPVEDDGRGFAGLFETVSDPLRPVEDDATEAVVFAGADVDPRRTRSRRVGLGVASSGIPSLGGVGGRVLVHQVDDHRAADPVTHDGHRTLQREADRTAVVAGAGGADVTGETPQGGGEIGFDRPLEPDHEAPVGGGDLETDRGRPSEDDAPVFVGHGRLDPNGLGPCRGRERHEHCGRHRRQRETNDETTGQSIRHQLRVSVGRMTISTRRARARRRSSSIFGNC